MEEKWFLKKHQKYNKKFIHKSINRFYRIALNRFNEKLKYFDVKTLLPFSFLNGQIPDYSNEFSQLYYYLKYFCAYSFLYHTIYLEVLGNIGSNKSFNVISLGCGGLIDYFGIHFALSKIETKLDFTYIGIDKIKWKIIDVMKAPKPLIEDIAVLVNLNSFLTKELNIIIFPHSFFEMQYSHVSKILFDTDFICKEFSIVFSYGDDRLKEKQKCLDKFFSDFETLMNTKGKYKCSIKHYDLGEGKISEDNVDFELEDNFRSAMKQHSLFQRCKKYSIEHQAHCSDSCNEDTIRSNIMVNKKYLHHTLMKFQKNDN